MAPGSAPPDDDLAKVAANAKRVQSERKRPLLVMFWPNHGGIHENHIDLLYGALTDAGLARDDPLPDLDVLLHTVGGDPVAAYRMAQLVRDYTRAATYLVPEYAYSGGTLIALSANKILLGDYAVLSPIDITLSTRQANNAEGAEDLFPEEMTPDTEVELVVIDYFIQVAKDARIEIEREFRQKGWKTSRTEVDSALLCEMTRQLGVLNIAKFYRERNITQEYARELLTKRMFGDEPSKVKTPKVDGILRRLVRDAPAHSFALDHNLCRDIGIAVEQMSEPLAQASRDLTRLLTELAHGRKVCLFVGGQTLPFLQYFPYNSGTSKTSKVTVSATAKKEAAHGNGRPAPSRAGKESSG